MVSQRNLVTPNQPLRKPYHAMLLLLLAELRNKIQGRVFFFFSFLCFFAGSTWPLFKRAGRELLFPFGYSLVDG